jgi:tetratricopeptide (TPR) repeat protein
VVFSLFSLPVVLFGQERGQTPDISIVSKPITDTMDTLQMRDARKNPPGDQKGGATQDNCLLPPLNLLHTPLIATSNLAAPSNAQKEYLAGCVDLRRVKRDSAEKHFRKAVQIYTQYSTAWVTLGQVLANQNHADEARNACTQASVADPKYLPAYLCLADLAVRDKEWPVVLQLTNQAIAIDPTASPLAYEYSAAASFRMNKLDDAEKSARRALEIDTNHTDPRVHFLLAQIYEAKRDQPNEILQLQEYLKFLGNSEEAASVKQLLAELEKSRSTPADKRAIEIESTGNHRSGPPPSTTTANEIQNELEEPGPSAARETALPGCNLDDVLPQVQRRIREFVENVQRFTATESLLHESLNSAGKVARADHGKFDYVVSIEESVPGVLAVNEYRNSRASSVGFHTDVVTKGLPALLLVFHPYYAGDFSMRCEGLTILKGNPVWQIRFRQRDDKPSRIRSYRMGTIGPAYEVKLQGRAWFTADSFQIIKLEADLLKAIPEIQLTVDHTSAEYGPVFFRSRGIEIWLPQTADLVSERKGKRLHERIDFSDYLLFAVDDKQELSTPKPQEWLSGAKLCRTTNWCDEDGFRVFPGATYAKLP